MSHEEIKVVEQENFLVAAVAWLSKVGAIPVWLFTTLKLLDMALTTYEKGKTLKDVFDKWGVLGGLVGGIVTWVSQNTEHILKYIFGFPLSEVAHNISFGYVYIAIEIICLFAILNFFFGRKGRVVGRNKKSKAKIPFAQEFSKVMSVMYSISIIVSIFFQNYWIFAASICWSVACTFLVPLVISTSNNVKKYTYESGPSDEGGDVSVIALAYSLIPAFTRSLLITGIIYSIFVILLVAFILIFSNQQ